MIGYEPVVREEWPDGLYLQRGSRRSCGVRHGGPRLGVIEKPADGYTIFQWSPPSMMVVPLTRKVPYTPLEDFIPIFMDITASNALYVRADSPYKTFEEFIDGATRRTSSLWGSTILAHPRICRQCN
ncbi:MAG: hypothetical protein GKR94_05490 [Gammaproteobacteria bacterium]|nr:hypothetical protein [Gammaproteobacteria bacterium]